MNLNSLPKLFVQAFFTHLMKRSEISSCKTVHRIDDASVCPWLMGTTVSKVCVLHGSGKDKGMIETHEVKDAQDFSLKCQQQGIYQQVNCPCNQ